VAPGQQFPTSGIQPLLRPVIGTTANARLAADPVVAKTVKSTVVTYEFFGVNFANHPCTGDVVAPLRRRV
jgi:hypothetical protein